MPQQKTTTILLVLIISVMLFSLFCEEQIPEGPELVQVIEASLTTDRQEYPQPSNYGNRYRYNHIRNFSTITDSKVRFQVKVVNTFDETVEGIDWTEISVKIWSTQLPNFTKTITFTEHQDDTEWLILHPGETHYIYALDSLVWDQTDDSCDCIYETETFVPFFVRLDSIYNKQTRRMEYFCDTTYFAPTDSIVSFETPIEIEAQASVKIFKNYDAIQSNVHRFQIKYFFPAGMIDRRKCPFSSGG